MASSTAPRRSWFTRSPLAAKSPSTAPRPRRRWIRALVSAALGLSLGLVGAELALRARDHGAFPHLNVYMPDDVLGVRLRPGATERVAFGGNPVTSVRINPDGFRGAPWPPPSDGEILVVGDSQVFGLGVEESEAFSAVIESIYAAKGAPRAVRNVGVPTYGPIEFRAVIDEQLTKRKINTVIYVVNLVNDLFEVSRPNKERHRVWDGWAVRAETAPASITEFPGRAWLFGQSHLVYAARELLHRQDAEGRAATEITLESEGTWKDILGASARAAEERARAERETARLASERRSELKKAADDVLAAQIALEDQAYARYPELEQTSEGVAYRKTHGNPGDIVIVESSGGVESERPFRITAQYLLKGAEVRARVEKLIRDRAEVEAQRPEWKTVLRSFEERAERQKRLAELHAAPLTLARSWSPLTPSLRDIKALCDQRSAKLLVVALPMDVQVSSDEWKKYERGGEVKPIDMSPTTVLLADLVSSAEAIGAQGLDATPALAAAEPGAFLNADIHMTPKGHRALAEAIVAKLEEPPAAPTPAPGLPAGRSFPPDFDEWASAPTARIRGTPSCVSKTVREWAWVTCARWVNIDNQRLTFGPTSVPVETQSPEPVALGVSVVEGGHREVLAFSRSRAASFVAPVLPGESLKAEVSWFDSTQTLYLVRSRDGSELEIAVEKVKARPSDDAAALLEAGARAEPRVEALCSCFKQATGKSDCNDLTAAPDVDCERTYSGDCAKLVACSRGAPEWPPRCLPGWVNAGALSHCYKSCGGAAGGACEVGTCSSWQGASVCM